MMSMLATALNLSMAALIFAVSTPAYAQSDAQTQQGALSMHGGSRYDGSAAHLSYVNPDAPKGGDVKIGAIGSFDTLNPYSIKGKAPMGLNLVYDRLMRRVWDEPFTMVPLIAQSYDMPADRSSITFALNPLAKFHDGSTITADDIAFSFETLKTSGRPNMRQVYKLVRDVQTPDAQTITFHLGDGYDRETVMIIAMMPVLSKAYWQDKTFDATTLDPDIILNGPYRIAAVDQGRSITYERVADYWAKDLLPNIGHYNYDRITYEYFRDDNVAFESFASGALDLRREGNSAKWQSDYNVPLVTQGQIIKGELLHGRPEPARGFIFNTRRAPFDDIKVREALSLMLDRHSINSILFNGKKNYIHSYFPNSPFDVVGPTVDRNTVQTDPRTQMRAARTLLQDAGWRVENGKQVKDGIALSFEVLLDNAEDEKIALHFAQSLKRLGIEMRIRSTDSTDFIRRIQNYDYDMVLHEWRSSLSPGTEQVLYWGCAAADQQGRFNYAGICDPAIDALAASIANTTTRDALVSAMQTLDAKLLAGHYMIPLFYGGTDLIAYQADIFHPAETPLYGAVLETWWMDTPKP